MRKEKTLWPFVGLVMLFVLTAAPALLAQDVALQQIYFSTEEDFTAGDDLAGGSVISDGDLLIAPGTLYMRNSELLRQYSTRFDLGLDAADVILASERIVVFSTELAHPEKRFTPGDLLSTTGLIIPNAALLAQFGIPRQLNLGLDAVQMIGQTDEVIGFLRKASGVSREEWLQNPYILTELLHAFGLDIWFSTEGTAPSLYAPLFLDGDLLSAAQGAIVLRNFDALPNAVPAGLPLRGVDFGMDAVTSITDTGPDIRNRVYFSTEILYGGNPLFTDGDVMLKGVGMIYDNFRLIRGFYPAADFLGLDALSIEWNTDIGPEPVEPFTTIIPDSSDSLPE